MQFLMEILWQIVLSWFAWLVRPWMILAEYLRQQFPAFDQSLDFITGILKFVQPWVDCNVIAGMLVVFFPAWFALWTYRLVKSWIPTLSGT